MGNEKLRKTLSYAGLPVILLALWLVKGRDVELIRMILWSTLLAFVYFASLSDLREQRIPNRLVVAMLGAWILLMVPQLFFQTELALALALNGLLGGVAGGILFLLVYMTSRKGLGGGDVKLMTVSGLYLGLNGALPSILYGSILLEIVAVILILMKKIGRKDAIPLVPFLFVGMVLTLFVQ